MLFSLDVVIMLSESSTILWSDAHLAIYSRQYVSSLAHTSRDEIVCASHWASRVSATRDRTGVRSHYEPAIPAVWCYIKIIEVLIEILNDNKQKLPGDERAMHTPINRKETSKTTCVFMFA